MEKEDNFILTFFMLIFILWNFCIAFGIWGGYPEGVFVKIEKLRIQSQDYATKLQLKLQEEQIEVLRTQVNRLEKHRHNLWGKVKL